MHVNRIVKNKSRLLQRMTWRSKTVVIFKFSSSAEKTYFFVLTTVMSSDQIKRHFFSCIWISSSCFLTVNLALSSMTSYPSTVGVIGLSSTCWLPAGSETERGQLEYATEGSRDPFSLARVTGLWRGGGVRLRPALSLQRDWRRELLSYPSLATGDEDSKLPETLPRDAARCGRLGLFLPPNEDLSMGTGTGTKGEAMFLSCVILPLPFTYKKNKNEIK